MVFAAIYKVYVGFSARRSTSDLREAYAEGLIDGKQHSNSVNRFLANPALTAILKEFVTVSSLPLKGVETDFAVDASEFSTSRFVRWHDHKYNRETRARSTFRCHLVCGVKIKIITAVYISGWTVHDSYFFVPLVTATARNSDISEVAADEAYSGRGTGRSWKRLAGGPTSRSSPTP